MPICARRRVVRTKLLATGVAIALATTLAATATANAMAGGSPPIGGNRVTDLPVRAPDWWTKLHPQAFSDVHAPVKLLKPFR